MLIKKRSLSIICIVGLVLFFMAAAIHAVTTVKEMIKLETKAYKSRKNPVVVFSHGKHQDAYKQKYPELYKAECGECHHDENNKPLISLKTGDDVKKCIDCHKKAEYIKGKKAKGLSKNQKLEYHANALHQNCKDCHRKANKKTGKKTAPVTCKKCHLKS